MKKNFMQQIFSSIIVQINYINLFPMINSSMYLTVD